MFHSPTLSKLKVWHAAKKNKMRIINGPQDGRAWRDVDTTWLKFSLSPRNVKLGLSTNGVKPFGQQQTNHSTWPITLV